MILDSSFYRVRKLTSNAYITYRFDDRLVMRHFIPCTSAILYTIANPVVWVANPTCSVVHPSSVAFQSGCAAIVPAKTLFQPITREILRFSRPFLCTVNHTYDFNKV